jgi:sarcosine oxidase, subunit alpha
MPGHRLPAPAGAFIDRARPLSFTFNGRRRTGFAGDTLAAALLAGGERLIGRSFKLHRPRGVFSCGSEEPCALVDVGSGGRLTPNTRATVLPLQEGLTAVSVNCWPGVRFDVGALNGLIGAALPAGFYYKTFKWPSWRLFEPGIRRLAGLGRAPLAADPDHYEEIARATDVLVVGAGLAGLAAAVAAARGGASTLLLSASAHLGGALSAQEDPEVAQLSAAAQRLGVQMLRRTYAFGVYDHNLLVACETLAAEGDPALPSCVLRERLWKIRARHIVCAAGSFERPLLFPDNDRPGVMLARAALRYARGYGVACGSRAVIAANCDAAYACASELRAAGIEIAALIDRRAEPGAQVQALDTNIVTGAAITAVHGARGVRGCRIARIGAPARTEVLECDLIVMAGGPAPAVHLHSQAGGRLRFVPDSAMFIPDGAAPGLYSVGACAGVFAREAAVGHAAALAEALVRGAPVPPAPVGGAGSVTADTRVPGVRGKQFVDLQNDVTSADVELAGRENYRSVEHLKRYTTTGMGTDQGKSSNINALIIMGACTGQTPDEVGTTRFRPPFAPVTLGTIAGRRTGQLYRPLKELPAQAWHAARGARFETYGDWRRPAAYPQAGETVEDAALREAGTVRARAGLFDGSPLGKLEVYGPDAARFLDLMYVGSISNLAVGQARYGVLLSEHGVLVDDGIVARLGPEHFWVNTTTAGSERTAAAFEEWLQCEWVDFKVLVTAVTSRWANVTVAGPRAWQWLQAVGVPASFAPWEMKHMTLRAGCWRDVPLRVLRASFSGELGYEVNLPADAAPSLWEALWDRSGALGGCLYGIEALQVLRIEKGYLHIGTDTDGTTLPQDVGLARGLERKSAPFVGRRSLARPAARAAGRLQLVGLRCTDGAVPLAVGAHIAAHAPPAPIDGRVTSSCYSPALAAPVALAMLRDGARRMGERLQVWHLGQRREAEVVKTPFVDPEGRRVHG